ncbi:Sterol-4-alpha-carboxylate 3-decarboxylating [Hyphodiscus hymeniophilus]|uniref:Sterol-4-alpha-carboxylate 3-decarboxylating n=1 Tax=Hyphodiscus hymeniophilus TaxID=353542 RepID=A0A9P6VFZ6_9HELO|nr:Sterol-4-alpha-carboxylate 3-decarboxylating [Hyphodiscus hymeniophilus]
MRVFVTGSTGFIGTAVVQELLNSGHQVLGLVRSSSNASKLTAAGAEVHNGSLEDLASLKSGAAQCDAVIHLAFVHDFTDFAGSCAKDRAAIEALGEALAGTGKPLVATGGILMLKQGQVGTEDDAPDFAAMGAPRAASEGVALALKDKGVRAMMIRLPPSVHGEGDKGFVPRMVSVAREKGVSAYIGSGVNRWPAVHRFDAAALYRLAIEKGVAGAVYHAVAEESIAMKEISGAIGNGLNVRVVSKLLEEAAVDLGFLAYGISSDSPASSLKTRKELGWAPAQPGLIADVEKYYLKFS